jgi:hypothetical protein
VVVVATSTVITATVTVFTNSLGRAVGTSTSIQVLPSTTSAITWDFSGVILTYPTIYAAYATFSRVSVSLVGTVCTTSTLSLALPTPTVWRPLIVVESTIRDASKVEPTVVSYLNSLPEVTSQLGGPIGSACDPIAGSGNTKSTSSLGTTLSVFPVPDVGVTKTITEPDKAQLLTVAPISADPSPVASAPQPPPSSPAPLPPPPPSSAAPSPPADSSNIPLPISSATPQPGSQAPEPSSVPLPSASSPPSPSGASPESSRADSASQVQSSPPPPSSSPRQSSPEAPSPPSGVPSSASPPPPVSVGRSTTTPRTISGGTTSAPQSSSSVVPFTGAGALPTGNIAGWLVGAAGLGLGLL